MENEIKLKVRVPQVGDSLPLDAVWNADGDCVGHYSIRGHLEIDSIGEVDEENVFGLPNYVEPLPTFRIQEIPGVTATTNTLGGVK